MMQKEKWLAKSKIFILNNSMSSLPNIRFFLFLIIFILFSATCFSMHVKFISSNDTTSEQILDTVLENQEYISIDLIEKAFESQPHFFLQTKKWKIQSTKNITWTFSTDNPFVQIGKKSYNLTFPVRKTTLGFFIPLQSSLVLLKLHAFNYIKYNYKKRSIIIKKKPHSIENLSSKQKNNGAIISFNIKPNIKYKALWTAPHYILTFEGTVDTTKMNKIRFSKNSLVRKVKTIQNKNSSQISLYIPKPIEPIELLHDSTSNQIRLIVRSKTKRASKEKVQIISKTIIIDPGHGGKDPGAVHSGIFEKDITLKVALKLRKKLKNKGYKILLTRTTDTFISLEDRPKFASKKGGDLFISLHCNAIEGSSSKLNKISGFVSYILRAGKTEEDASLAQRENLVFKNKNQKSKKELSDIDWFLLEHELNLYSQQSEKFALSIVKSFSKESSIKKYKTGASQAGFFVLVGTFMPAVLFEMGFITNSKDLKYLTSSKGQNSIAHNLASAIDNYFNSNS